MGMLSTKHFISIEHATIGDIQHLIDTGYVFKEVLDRPVKKVPSLSGQNILNLFLLSNPYIELSE